jgi:hypothetical protein
MKDASFHDFDMAYYAFGMILPMLEDGALTWVNWYLVPAVGPTTPMKEL